MGKENKKICQFLDDDLNKHVARGCHDSYEDFCRPDVPGDGVSIRDGIKSFGKIAILYLSLVDWGLS